MASPKLVYSLTENLWSYGKKIFNNVKHNQLIVGKRGLWTFILQCNGDKFIRKTFYGSVCITSENDDILNQIKIE